MTTQISKMTSREAFDKAMEQQGEPVAWLHRGCATTEHGYTSDERARAVGYKPLYTSAPTIPEGYVLVPIDVTDKMAQAFNGGSIGGSVMSTNAYHAMIAAAPKPNMGHS
jgi:hypothetical protein